MKLIDNILGSDWRTVARFGVVAGLIALAGDVVVDGAIVTDLELWKSALTGAGATIVGIIVSALLPNS